MDFNNINHIVFSSEAAYCEPVKEAEKNGLNCYSFIDTRSAIYGAAGIAARNNETVIVTVGGDNASRSSFSGMTEAFYRNLPVILITVGGELDYTEELCDVVNGHYKVQNINELEALLKNDILLPAHIEFVCCDISAEKKDCRAITEVLSDILTADDYLYFGTGIDVSAADFKCKVVRGGMPNCYDGALANVLGASLAHIHKRYIGLAAEEEFLHDMNTLGNINVNDNLMFIVVCKNDNSLITDYAGSLGFETAALSIKNLNFEQINAVLRNNKKSIMIIYGDVE